MTLDQSSPRPSERMASSPTVSLIVAMRNEATAISACLRSIIDQDYPPDRLEVLVYDGDSTDASATIARDVIGDRPGWSVLENSRRIQAISWNRGIAASRGDVIGIVSGHVVLDPGYVSAAVDALRRTSADMVGGPVRAEGEGPLATAVAIAMSTRFGVGGASFRYLDREADVDTVFMGLCRRETYLRFRFDEEMVRNQDDELSYRILDAGGRILCSPTIKSSYRSRTTIAALFRQYFDYGYWKVRVLRKHPAQVRFRHVIPSLFLVAVSGAVFVSIRWPWATAGGALIVAAYVAVDLIASRHASAGRGWRVAVALPVIYATLHVSYGLGMLAGLIRHPRWPPGSLRVLAGSLAARAGPEPGGLRDGPERK